MIKSISNEVLNTLNKSEFDVLTYITNHQEKVVKMTVNQLAKETFVSTATVIRLCKKLGFTGFNELKYNLKKNLKKPKKGYNLELIEENYSQIIKRKIYDIQKTCELINEEVIEKVLNIFRTKKIHFFGKGLSEITCEYLTNQLLQINILAINHTNTHIAYLYGEKMDENDAIFILSLSGETGQPLKMAQIAKARGATVISITTIGMNSLAKLADINLFVYAEDDEQVEFDNKSRAPVLILFQIIFDMYINRYIKSLS
ncbi:MurR/RpiR family transcriptional regulator [Anaerobranca gottschalkii]|uniref:Transcriptional regulator, RpiR family n=1 Tax=Anaerobranca gottschalkii DSM 13577 TaxID=1120990 RepID=A0A1I0C790_9FIRM|nr:MurR/RpiR family transcriptional regulator [Anaerobranca gottschalkii]SET15418.1 transcriptional regulator, RpiR family [Anaerobranca gottschalkii DSM 13577]